MEYRSENGNIILYQEDFNLDETLDCGQAFRWERAAEEDGRCTYNGFFLDKPLKISEAEESCFILYNTSEEEFLTVWKDYFDLDTDYGKIKQRLSADDTLKKACEFAGGNRIAGNSYALL